MAREVFKKRLEYLEKIVIELKQSKAGNYYGVLKGTESKDEYHVHMYHPKNIQKATIKNIGNEFLIPTSKVTGTTVLLTKKGGGLYTREAKESRFSPLSYKRFNYIFHGIFSDEQRVNFVNMFFYGRKAEWLKDNLHLCNYKIAHQFKSPKELKNFLKFDFMSLKKFMEHTKSKDFFELALWLYSTNCQKNLDKHNIDEAIDLVEMQIKLKRPIFIPKGKNSFLELHDELVMELNKKDELFYSDEEIIIKTPIRTSWKIIKTPRELFRVGRKMSHCIGSSANKMDMHLFLEKEYKSRLYHAKVDLQGRIIQMKGRKNSEPPEELKKELARELQGVKQIKIEMPKKMKDEIKQSTFGVLDEVMHDYLPF